MKRRCQLVSNGSNLLLDTLCNTLGSVIFIALLILLIAKNAPTLVPSFNDKPIEGIKETINYLKDTYSIESLKLKKESLNEAIASFKATEVTPVPTNKNQTALLNQRKALIEKIKQSKKDFHKITAKKTPEYLALPVLQRIPPTNDIKILVFEDNKVSISSSLQPFTRSLLKSPNKTSRKRVDDITLTGNASKLNVTLNHKRNIPKNPENIRNLFNMQSATRWLVYVKPSGFLAYKKTAPVIWEDDSVNISLTPLSENTPISLHSSTASPYGM